MNESPMTQSSTALSPQAIHLGFWTMTMKRRRTMAFKRFIDARRAEADSERYRRYHEAKRKIPMNLPPAEYEAEVKRLAKKFKI